MKTRQHFNIYLMNPASSFKFSGVVVKNSYMYPNIRLVVTEDVGGIYNWLLAYKGGRCIITTLHPDRRFSKINDKVFLKVFCNED